MNEELDPREADEEATSAPEPEAGEPTPEVTEAASLWPREEYDPPDLEVAAARMFGLGEPPPKRRRAVWLGWLIPMVVLAGLCAFLVVQNRAAAAAVEELTTRVPALLLPTGTPNPLQAQLEQVRQKARIGNFWQASARAEHLALPPGARQPVAPAPGGAEATNLTAAAEQFIKAHPEVEQRLAQYSTASKQLKDAGRDVQPLREARDRVFAAADQGDLAGMQQALADWGQRLQAMGAPAPTGSSEMQAVVEEFKAAFEQAQKTGRDPRAAIALMKQAEQLGQSGDRAGSLKAAKAALAALRNAPRLPRGGGRMVRMPGGPPPAAVQQVLGMTLGLMASEDQEMGRAQGLMGDAILADREANQEQVAEILDQARQALNRIHQRRMAFSQQLQKMHKPPTGPKPPVQGSSGQTPQPPPQTARGPVERIVEILDRVRDLTGEQYQEAKAVLARNLIGLVLSVGPKAPEAPKPGVERTPQEQAVAAEVEVRVREKLRIAQAPYEKLKREGQDTQELEAMIAEARQALYAGDLAKAEEKADEVLRKLGITPELAPEGTRPLTLQGGEAPPEPGTGGIDLRRPGGDAPAGG